MAIRRASILEIGIDENGVPRRCEIAIRCDDSVYLRVHQVQQDCYMELREVAVIHAEMLALVKKR
jgi:hypothetical protein